MLTLNLENLQKVSSNHGISNKELESKANLIPQYLEQIHAREQDFYKIVDDNEQIQKIEQFINDHSSKYKDIVVLGIGGSALGTICLQQSLKHLYENELQNDQTKLHVVDNIDPALIKEIEDIIDLEKTLFIVVTKSGGTPETLSQYFYFRKRIENSGLIPHEHFAFITDPERGLLRKISKEEPIPTFDIPQKVGGRFSVLTPVGLLPAKLIGINIKELMAGAKEMRDSFLSEDYNNNLPFQLAAIQYALAQKGKIMNVIMPYSHRLIRFADWYRQLLAESIGKRVNNQGKEVFTGITPINALGVTDQHSQNQLYNEGPNDKFFIIMNVEKNGPELQIPNPFPNDEVVSYLNDLSFNKLLKTEMEGTKQAFTQNDRPNITISIDEVNAKNLGALFMLFEASIAFLGEFNNINAFDQPGVELSKNLTKELLLK